MLITVKFTLFSKTWYLFKRQIDRRKRNYANEFPLVAGTYVVVVVVVVVTKS